jgi:hypothetical protein
MIQSIFSYYFFLEIPHLDQTLKEGNKLLINIFPKNRINNTLTNSLYKMTSRRFFLKFSHFIHN